MPAFGERLKRERESHGTTIEQIAAASGIGQSYLEALERDEFGALPGPAFGKLYIRAYAEVLGFDPQPWIDDYDRERRAAMPASLEPARSEPTRPRPVGEALAQWREARIREREEPAGEIAPVEVPLVDAAPVEAVHDEAVPDEPDQPTSEPARAIREISPAPTAAPRSRRPVVLFAVALLVAGAGIAYLAFFRRAKEDPAPIAIVKPEPTPVESSPTPSPTPPPTPEAKPPSLPKQEKPVDRATMPTPWVVTESGVGRRIVNLRLEGEADTFPEGSRVCFSSRVIGGRSGAILRHVWIRDGKIEQSIPLRLGGPDWRTHSNKTLGRPGAWTVEARDEDGRVLASAGFSCTPAAR
jgi:transcriptional regulator with XRE-family HTH domain